MNDIKKANAIAWYTKHVKQENIANRLVTSAKAKESH